MTMYTIQWNSLLVVAFLGLCFRGSPTTAFSPKSVCKFVQSRGYAATHILILPAQHNDNDNINEEGEDVNEEQFYRDLMGLLDEDMINSDGGISNHPENATTTAAAATTASHTATDDYKQKKKGKTPKYGSVKQPHDNRDALPFLVQVMTPPTHVATKLTKKQRRANEQNGIEDKEDKLGVVGEELGEFVFEKNTGAGDKIAIDDEVFLVQRAKCQYRYAGAQKFVMVRKILQVKPIQRVMQEEYLARQFQAASAPESDAP